MIPHGRVGSRGRARDVPVDRGRRLHGRQRARVGTARNLRPLLRRDARRVHLGPRPDGAGVLAELARVRRLRTDRGLALRPLGSAGGGDHRRRDARRGPRADRSDDLALRVLSVLRPPRRRRPRLHDHPVDDHRHALVRAVARDGDGHPQRGEFSRRGRLLPRECVAHRDARVAWRAGGVRRRRLHHDGLAGSPLSRSATRRAAGARCRASAVRQRSVDAPARVPECPALGGVQHDGARSDRVSDHGDPSGRARCRSRLRAGHRGVALRVRGRLHDGRQSPGRLVVGSSGPGLGVRARFRRGDRRDRLSRADQGPAGPRAPAPLRGLRIRFRNADRAALGDSGRRLLRATSRRDPGSGPGGGRTRGRHRPFLGGWLFDVTGSYQLAFAAAGVAVAGSAGAAWIASTSAWSRPESRR